MSAILLLRISLNYQDITSKTHKVYLRTAEMCMPTDPLTYYYYYILFFWYYCLYIDSIYFNLSARPLTSKLRTVDMFVVIHLQSRFCYNMYIMFMVYLRTPSSSGSQFSPSNTKPKKISLGHHVIFIRPNKIPEPKLHILAYTISGP